MNTLIRAAAPALMLVAPFACGGPETLDPQFEATAHEYIEELLAMNPEFATALGDHRYDGQLGDYSRAGIQASLELEKRYLARLNEIDPARLTGANAVDYEMLKLRIERSIFEIETLREHEWNPLLYNPGGAIYGLIARDFAPLEERLRNAKARLEALPKILEAARENLQNPPKVHTETAILQNGGTIRLVRDEIHHLLQQAPELRAELQPAQEMAAAALREYGDWLQEDLLPRSNGEFRLGEQKFRRKLAYALDSDLSMDDILRRAEAALAETQAAMYETALPLYREMFPAAGEATSADRKKVIRAVLDRLAQEHPADETVVEDARRTLDEATAFVREKQLMTLPPEPIEIIVMPEFQRGVAIAYCDSPGPLEKDGETFYAIAPTPEDWPEERVRSFYREYNHYMLHDLTVHEAMPGHYLQLAHSNRFQAPTLVRGVFYSGPFVEGWAVYAEQLMVEHGYQGPEVKMQQLKMYARAVINAILDQKIHTAAMSEQEAMDLMRNEGFQEEGEAAGKWRRACLTSAQLSTYFVGNAEVRDIRKAWEAEHGPIRNWRAFHDTMLSHGSPSPKHVRRLLGL